MRITILGSGTSTGIPEIGCTCPVCTSVDPRDKRLRASALVETQGRRILIDCGPDFRQQMLGREYRRIDGVLVTHEHYDHVGGLDDLRPFCRFGKVPVYAEAYVSHNLRVRMPYCFREQTYPGIPDIRLVDINPAESFYLEEVKITPVRVMHGKMPILGYRIGNMAYLTDLVDLPEEEYEKLHGLECLIMDALRLEPHISHQSLAQALEKARRIGAKETYFIHMSHHLGLHRVVGKHLPAHVHLAYDGLEIYC